MERHCNIGSARAAANNNRSEIMPTHQCKNAAIKEASATGGNIKEIAGKYGVPVSSLYRWLRDIGEERSVARSKEEIDAIVSDVLNTEKTLQEISRDHGVGVTAINKYLRRRGYRQVRLPRVPQELINSAVDEIEQGDQYAQDVAEKYDICRHTLQREMKRRGIRLKPGRRKK